MTQDTDAARASRLLLEIGAVHIRPSEPFTYTSGRVGPVYVDCRKVISFPRARRALIAMMAAQVEREIGLESLDAVAGGETAGIPYAAWLSDALSLPMLYVRKKPKGFGRNAQIEGEFAPGARVLLVEDLSNDGGSKITFAEAMRKAEAVVSDCMVVFSDEAPGARETMAKSGLRLHALANWATVLGAAIDGGRIQREDANIVQDFLADPVQWSVKHGGKG
jgi:orotate phosphoribosyltransferase